MPARLGYSETSQRASSTSWVSEPALPLVDILCYTAVLLGVILKPALLSSHSGLADILELRVSIPNLIAAALCLTTWHLLIRMTAGSIQKDAAESEHLCSLLFQIAGATLVVGLLFLIRKPGVEFLRPVAGFFTLSLALLSVRRITTALLHRLIDPVLRKPRSVLLVGSGPRGRKAASHLAYDRRWQYSLVGFVDRNAGPDRADVLGGIAELESILSAHAVDEVIIALPIRSMYDECQHAVAVCERLGIQCRYSTDLFETSLTKRRSLDEHDPSSVRLHVIHDTGLAIKRTFDVIVAATALVCLSPLFLVIALGIKTSSDGPVFFRQKRFGLNRHLFTMYKFRSMEVNAEAMQSKLEHMNQAGGPVFKISRDPRVTKFGEFLRRTSLDELPQLWNVLIGDMSLVGPRPLPVRDVSRFPEAWLLRRFSVPQGITGLWQVNGRSNTSFERWIELDLHYIDRWSLLLDFVILAKTFSAVIRQNGAA